MIVPWSLGRTIISRGPIEEVYRPKVTQVRQAEVGYRSRSTGGVFQQGQVQPVDEEAAMLTGDENVVNVQFNIQYHIKPGDGAVDYLFNVMQPDAVVKKAAEAAMREVIGKTTLEAALTEGRVKIQGEVTDLLQDILDHYRVGGAGGGRADAGRTAAQRSERCLQGCCQRARG